jgi:hypothetical protein
MDKYASRYPESPLKAKSEAPLGKETRKILEGEGFQLKRSYRF